MNCRAESQETHAGLHGSSVPPDSHSVTQSACLWLFRPVSYHVLRQCYMLSPCFVQLLLVILCRTCALVCTVEIWLCVCQHTVFQHSVCTRVA